MLRENDLFLGEIDKVKIAIERLKNFEPPEGYYLAFSGGKDSIVIKKLADLSGVKYDAHYNNTTIDPPEVIYFIRKHYPDVKIEQPEKPFLVMLVEKKFMPKRQARWCCEYYKERGGIGRLVLTGVRWAESVRRRKRQMVETCYRKTKRYLHLIIDWTDQEVWQFIKEYNLAYCNLYDRGWRRIGCLMCPFASTKARLKEAEAYPKHRNLFIKAFCKLYQALLERDGKVRNWASGEEMFWWWIKGKGNTKDYDQTVLFE